MSMHTKEPEKPDLQEIQSRSLAPFWEMAEDGFVENNLDKSSTNLLDPNVELSLPN